MENNRRRKRSRPRQEWNPHWILKILYVLWSACVAAVKIALGAAATVLLICIVCGFVFVGILGGYLQEDILPQSGFNLDNYDLDQTSFVYYVDNSGEIQVLQQVHTSTDRQWATLEEMPEDLINAAIAIEDKRFYEHQGVDWITTVKACANLFFGGGSKFGGSTITQQLIKNQTGEDSVTVQRKVMEIFRAQQFEKTYDKDTVMEWYLNTIYLGKGCYGVKSAAAEYFGKELQNLTTAECASLISITNNPSIYGPYSSTYEWKHEGEVKEMTGKERNRIRQMYVLDEMLDQQWLTQEEYDAAVAQEMIFKSGIDLVDKIATCKSCRYSGTVGTLASENEKYYCPNCGNEVSVSQDSSQEVYSWFVDTVLEDVATDLAALSGVNYASLDDEGQKNWMALIQRGGYHIYTTLDMDVQEQVDAIYTDLSKIPTTRSNQQLQSGIVVIDNTTGDIVALSGGVGEKVTHDAFNRATDSKLQTGSSMKPVAVYAPAFEAGAISPVTVVKDLPISYSGGAFPKNDNRTYSYSRTIYSGVEDSVNGISVNTLEMIGFDYAFNFAKDKFGLSTLTDHYETANGTVKSDKGYSPLGLGALTVGATIRDMSAAYATFANDGIYREARTYTKVYDSNGNLVLDNTQESRQILSEKTVNYMNYCLQNAVESGTGTAAKISGHNVAGKTGTTSSSKDRWFCGYTSYYTAAVWCGYDNPEVIKLTGSNKSNPAARLWKMVMSPLHSGLSKSAVYDSSNFRSYSVCLDSGDLATDACKKDTRVYEYSLNRVASAYAYKEDAPRKSCDKHVMVDYCSTGNAVANDYCHKFAAVTDVEIVERALVKLSKSEVNEIKKAGDVGLSSAYTDGSYVYYEDGDWHGFSGNANKNAEAPYLICSEHTKESWEAYEKAEQEKAEQERLEQERLEQERLEQQQQQAGQPATP